MTGHPTEALAFGQSAQAIAESLGDVPLQVTGNLYLGAACLWHGRLSTGRGSSPESPAVARRRSEPGTVWPHRISCRDGPLLFDLGFRRPGKVQGRDRPRPGRPPPRRGARSPLQPGLRVLGSRLSPDHQGRTQPRRRPARTRAGAESRVEPDLLFSGQHGEPGLRLRALGADCRGHPVAGARAERQSRLWDSELSSRSSWCIWARRTSSPTGSRTLSKSPGEP